MVNSYISALERPPKNPPPSPISDHTYRRCNVNGCNNLGRSKGIINGRFRRRAKCYKHCYKTERQSNWFIVYKNKYGYVCERCGWEGPCDTHRKIAGKDGGKYTKDNIEFICPNCHRLEHWNG